MQMLTKLNLGYKISIINIWKTFLNILLIAPETTQRLVFNEDDDNLVLSLSDFHCIQTSTSGA